MGGGHAMKRLAAAAAATWLLIHLTNLSSATAADTLFSNQSITEDETLVSESFVLGFFSPFNSTNRYLGIWFRTIPVQTVVWIANRDRPIPPGGTGVLKLRPDGDLVLLNSKNSSILWSTGTAGVSNPVLQLLDNGNLFLRQGNDTGSSVYPWQSFDHPTNVLLPGMKLGMDMATSVDRYLTSWMAGFSDPSTGNFALKMGTVDSGEAPVPVLWDTSERLQQRVELHSNGVFNFIFVSEQNETCLTYSLKNQSAVAMLVLNHNGEVRRDVWIDRQSEWSTLEDLCNTYPCGPNGVCSADQFPVCSCILGFQPRSPIFWADNGWSDGCVRSQSGDCEVGGRFVSTMPSILVPPSMANAVTSSIMTLEDCSKSCISNSSCTGYASAVASVGGGTGCIMWFGDLIHLKKSENGGQDLYVMQVASSQGCYSRKIKSWVIAIGLIALLTAIGVICSLTVICILIFFRTILKRKKNKRGVANIRDLLEAKGKNLELPLYTLSTILAATENFSPDNKLGEGGFGPVYKGMLFEVQVAVKRLSRSSAQGLEEFKSEIQLLAKLQHTNLVKVLGCCIEAEEKIVVYEYMKNGSLDKYLFDPHKGGMLDWHKRVHIIEGITQGLLYLHKYSRLRVIHRDLKASNILLDADTNPKISDFGMARIFSLDKSQVNTNRVVGTYGYMSPEYAMQGVFSVKSDVFSFGVLLLEILSGKRNVSHHNHGSPQNLLGYAWELLKQGKEVELMDTSLGEACPTQDISRYVKVALLCVQELAVDRPTIADVSDMLNNQSVTLPTPKQPAFFIGRCLTSRDANLEMQLPCSNNFVSLSLIDGR